MSTATAEPRIDTNAAFMSRSPNQVLVRRQAREVADGFGGKKILNYSDWLAQEQELNRQRELKGEDTHRIDDTPWRAEFVNSEYRVPDVIDGHEVSPEGKAKLIAWLRQHPKLNNPGPSGFWEMGKAPDEPRPTITEQMTEIADASAEGDIERLEAAKVLEEDTHNREAILMAAETGIARLRQFDSETGDEAGTEGTGPDESRSVDD